MEKTFNKTLNQLNFNYNIITIIELLVSMMNCSETLDGVTYTNLNKGLITNSFKITEF